MADLGIAGGATPFWLCQIGGAGIPQICRNISRAVPSIDDGSTNAIFTTYYGSYPILDYGYPQKPQWCNGGIPQLANLSYHAERMSHDLDARVDKEFTGLIVLDYESWWPTWNGTTNELYRNASRALARSQLPAGASDAQVEHKAIADFDAASLAFFTFSATKTKQLRPRARVAFYSGILTNYWHDDPAADEALFTAQIPWWESVDVIMPDIYLPYSSPDSNRTKLIEYATRRLDAAAQVNALLAKAGKATKPIIPYTWYRYHESGAPSALSLLSDSDAELEFFGAKLRATANNAIIWGSERDPSNASKVLSWFQRHASQFDQYYGHSKQRVQDPIEPRGRVPPDPPSDGMPARRYGGAPIDPYGPVPTWQPCSL